MSPHGKAHRVPIKRLAESGSMWLMCLSQLGTNVGWIFLVTWLPRYLEEVHRLPIGERGLLASIPLMVGWAGMLSGGWFTDRLTRGIGPRWGRALPIVLSRFLAMGAYLVCLFDLGPWAVTAAFAVVAFATDFGNPAMWAFNLDVGGRYVGSVLGWGNMWGNFGAALSPLLLNAVIGDGGYWNWAFVTCAAAFLFSGLCALGINATVPIAPAEEGV
jgi:ACS family glucarate transporter-like MFS transporter